ncbi:leucyl aminopeptidase [Oceanivirga salmonicida]|uniref:leucyl aminopeptidase n=1 Tax=Oceanivirga salmonicida TaxID=1769291 RepID=UPI00082ADA10|nr:leucyl aminopeptidase [Oceanivirga salmonicida]
MKFILNGKGGLKVDLVFENTNLDNKVFNHLKEKELFTGKLKQIYVNTYEEVAFVGLGNSETITLNEIREVFFDLAKELDSKKVSEITLEVPKFEKFCCKGVAGAISEGLLQSEYNFNKFTVDKKERTELTVNYVTCSENAAKGIEESETLMKSVFITRDLVNLPSNYIYPETLANKAKEILSPLGVKVTIYDKKQIKEMGMEAFYSVGKGSDNEPRLIVMEYENNPESNERLGLVGKGITYDSGGYSLKPNDGMKTMFCDMGGAATVIGSIHAMASSKVKANVVGVVAACENAVSGHSYKPGDIIGSLSGKTIEVDNTDAEGRVTLADSVYYTATTMKATKIIDLATLTGACLVALGEVYSGSVTNNQEFFNQVKEAADKSGEKIWQLPTDPMFAKQNKSKVADIKNTGGRLAGTITAGMFVGEFNNNLPWVHLDIAGTAYLSSPYSYLPHGATGIHVKTLYRLVAKGLNCK